MKRKLVLVWITLTSLAYTLGLVYYAATRPVDGDEGYYATAARLVWKGERPYRDFFFQQAPLVPYLYSWIWWIRPNSLVAMRTQSAVFGGLVILVWGLFLGSMRTDSSSLLLVTFAVVLLNPYWVSWHVVLKTYAVANLLISAALICLFLALKSRRLGWYIGTGVALGLCASARSLYGPIIPLAIAWLTYREKKSQNSYRSVRALAAGSALGLLPMIMAFVVSPSAFLFDNFRYHSLDAGYMWLDNKLVEGYQSIGHVLLVFAAHGLVGLFGFHPYFTIEITLAVVGINLWRKRRRTQTSSLSREEDQFLHFTFLALVVYVASALVPFPPYEQYFDSPIVPFLIPFLVLGLEATLRARTTGVLVLVSFLALFWAEVPRESAWNSNAPEWKMSTYREITRIVEHSSTPDEPVLSFWPGYVFESGRKYWPGLEDNFTFRITNKIGPEERARYHLASVAQITDAVSKGVPRLIILAPENVQKEFFQNLTAAQIMNLQLALNAKYLSIAKINTVQVYQQRTSAPLTRAGPEPEVRTGMPTM